MPRTHDAQLLIRMPTSLLTRLEAQARRNERTKAAEARLALRRYLGTGEAPVAR